MEQTETYSFNADFLRNVKVLGRQPKGAVRQDGSSAFAGVDLTYSCSGIEAVFTGESLWLQIEADWSAMEPWLVVELDGIQIQRFPVQRGHSEVELFAHMNAGEKRSWHVRVMRETQPMGEKNEYVRLTGLREQGGHFTPLPAHHHVLEFVGDSITTGEGAVGAKHDNDWASVFFGGSQSYPRRVADALNADFRVVSQSGWGISSSWNDQRSCRIPRIYPQVCGALTSEQAVSAGMDQPYDFAANRADAIIINLGTNDAGAFGQSGQKDPQTGEFYDARLLADGLYDPASSALIVHEARAYLQDVRRLNSDAAIVWALGAYSSPMVDLIGQMVDRYIAESGDKRVRFVRLDPVTDATIGSHEHPGVLWHEYAARTLIPVVQQMLGEEN